MYHTPYWSYEPTLFHHGAPLYTSTTWAQLLQTMCLPDWLPNCGSTACRQAPWLASFCCQQGQPGEIKQWYCDPWVGSIKVNGPMVGSWGTLGLRLLWGTHPKPQYNDLLCRWWRMCPTNCLCPSEPMDFLPGPACTLVPGPKVSDLTVRTMGSALCFKHEKAGIWVPSLPERYFQSGRFEAQTSLNLAI